MLTPVIIHLQKLGCNVFAQIMFYRIGSSFSTIVHTQLRKDTRNVVANGPFTEEQLLGDLAICFAFRNQQQYMFFLLAQMLECRSFLFLHGAAYFLEDALRHGWVEKRF